MTPKLRFKGFTDDWEQRKLGELCSIVTKQTGFDYTATIKDSLLVEPTEDTLPYLQTKNFTGTSIDYNTDYYIPIAVAKEFPKINLDEKCLLFSIVGASVGNVGFFPGDRHCFLSGAICVSKLINQDDADYLYHFMCSKNGQNQIQTCTKGGAQATITIEDIRNFSINLPSIEERKAIGILLSSVDNLITLHQRKYNELVQIKKGLSQKLFNGQLHFKSSNNLKFQNWEEVIFGDLFELYDRKNKHSYQQYTIGKNGIKDLTNTVNYNINKHKEFIPNSLILGIGIEEIGVSLNTYGCCSPVYTTFNINESVIDPLFCEFFLPFVISKNRNKFSRKSTRREYEFVIKDLQLFSFQLPCLEEQKKIASLLLMIDKEIEIVNRELEEWKTIKKGFLQQMFI